MSTRLDAILKAGMEFWATSAEDSDALIQTIAIMLDAAGARPKGAPVAREDIKEPSVSPAEFFEILRENGGGKVLCDAYDPATFGTIGKKFAKVGIEQADVMKFRTWVLSGGLNWVRDPFTWDSLCRSPKYLLLDWITRARAYDPAKVASSTEGSKRLSFNFKEFVR